MIEVIIIFVLIFLLIATNIIWFVSLEKSDTRWFTENIKLNKQWADELTRQNNEWREIYDSIQSDYNKLFVNSKEIQNYYIELIEKERENNA